MKFNVFAVLIFLFVSFAAVAQKSDKVQGKWEYEDVYEKEKLDSVGVKLAQTFFSGMTLNLKSDGTYEFLIMGKTEVGKWALSKDQKKITLTNGKGEKNDVTIVNVSDTSMVIKLVKGTFIMKKVA